MLVMDGSMNAFTTVQPLKHSQPNKVNRLYIYHIIMPIKECDMRSASQETVSYIRNLQKLSNIRVLSIHLFRLIGPVHDSH